MRGRRILVAVLAAAWTIAAPCGADQLIKLKVLTLVVPTGSPVRYSGDDGFLSASFTGTFVLTGVYHATYTKTNGGGYSDVWFEPDAALVAKLPHWQRYKQHASQITFDNKDDFLKAALPNDAPTALRHKRPASISGRTAIKVSTYETGVECDWPWFTVHFLSVERAPVLLADAKNDFTGC